MTFNYSYGWQSNGNGYIDIDVNKNFSLINGGSKNIVLGDFIATGNSVLSGNKNTPYFAGSDPVAINDDTYITNLGDRTDNKNSSAANLRLPDYVNAGHIIWAGLFWQGQIHGTASSTAEVDTKVSGWNSVHLRTPDNIVHTITAPIGGNTKDHSTYHYAYTRNGQFRYFYEAYVDVTNIIKNGGIQPSTNNQLVVGNVMATPGVDNPSDMYFSHINEPNGAWYSGVHMGHFGGWSLIVVYNVDLATSNSHPNAFSYHNVSIFNGFDQFLTWGNGSGIPFETTIQLSGFLTPKSGVIDSKLLFFGGGGDYGMDHDTLQVEDGNSPGSFVDLTNFRNGGTQKFNGTFTDIDHDIFPNKSYFQGMDLDIFDTSNIMKHDQTSTQIKFGVVKMQNYCDQVFPQVLAFSTKIFVPKICYDYTYGQNGNYITASDTQGLSIKGSFNSNNPLDVKLYLRNQENSDVTLKNLSMHIEDINTTQAVYKRESTYIAPPGQSMTFLSDSGREVSDAYDRNITIGDVGGLEYLYTYYSLDIRNTGDIDMPINAHVSYDLVVNINGTDLQIGHRENLLKNFGICQDSGSYKPTYGSFNIVHPAMARSGNPDFFYNLPTQVVKRPEHYKLEFMIPGNDNKYNLYGSTDYLIAAAIETISADGFHYTDATCTDDNSTKISHTRVWGFINKNEHLGDLNVTEMDNAGFFDKASSNAAFLISAPLDGNGSLIIFDKLGSDSYRLHNFPSYGGQQCSPDFVPPTGNSRQISRWCGDNTGGNSDHGGGGQSGLSLSRGEVRTCLQCIFGYQTKRLCSRDNFAIRPEAFYATITDSNGSTSSSTSSVAVANNAPAPSPNVNLAGGYNYLYDVNATTHLGNDASPGYSAEVNATFVWAPTISVSNCNDTNDKNNSFPFTGGVAQQTFPIDQVGEYDMNMTDSKWTRVDHISEYMVHHNPSYFKTNQNADCLENDNSVQTSANRGINGCDISSTHTNLDTSTNYTDLHLRFYPYTFDQSGITPKAGPYTRTGGQTFIYIDTPPTLNINNTDMSYNMNGTFYASGKNRVQLSNFVNGCYAEDVNMSLHYVYNTPAPTQKPYLWYSIKDYNTTDSTVVYRPASGSDNFERPSEPTAISTPISITQAKNFFAKDMNGSITMDLGFNFKRDYNKPVNPRSIEFQDFNITYVTNPSNLHADLSPNYQIHGNKDLDQNVTFLYARAKPSIYFYQTTTGTQNTPIMVEVYCNRWPTSAANCPGVDIVNGQTNQYQWFLSVDHNMSQNDGNITLGATNGSILSTLNGTQDPATVTINGNTNGRDKNIQVLCTAPNTTDIDFDTTTATTTSDWLIYNKDSNSIPSPFYRVKCINIGDWAGYGKTGHVMETNSSKTTNRRLGW